MRGALMQYYTGTIQQVIQHTHDVATLVFDAKGDASFRYTAGQYITVIKPESRTPEGKAYSLSSQILTKSAKSARETSLNQ